MKVTITRLGDVYAGEGHFMIEFEQEIDGFVTIETSEGHCFFITHREEHEVDSLFINNNNSLGLDTKRTHENAVKITRRI